MRWIAFFMVAAMLAGCGGRSANPVASYMPGDEQRSCTGLQSEIASNEQEIIRLLPYEDAAGKNVALGVAGVFLIVPFFSWTSKMPRSLKFARIDSVTSAFGKLLITTDARYQRLIPVSP